MRRHPHVVRFDDCVNHMKRSDAILYARTAEHRRAVDDARRVVEKSMAANDSWYVAFSAGKDSTCVLSLVRAYAPKTPAVISIHKWRLPETTEYLSRIAGLEYVASGSSHGTDGWGRNWVDCNEADSHYPGIVWFDKDADRQSFGRSERGCFLGLREEENSYRRINLRTLGLLHQSKRHEGRWLCSPIGKWKVLDVWAFIASNDLDYNKAYDVMERINVPLAHQRIGPLAVDAVLRLGQLAVLKRGWPGFWNEYVAAHPEARQYA